MKSTSETAEKKQNMFLASINSKKKTKFLEDILIHHEAFTFLFRIYPHKIALFLSSQNNPGNLEFLKNYLFTETIQKSSYFKANPCDQVGGIFLQYTSSNCALLSFDPESLTLSPTWLANLHHLSRARGLSHEMVSLFRSNTQSQRPKQVTWGPFNQIALTQLENSVFNVYFFGPARGALELSEPLRRSMFGLYRRKGLPWAKIQKRFAQEKCIWLENNIRTLKPKTQQDFSISFDLGFDGLGRILGVRLSWSGWGLPEHIQGGMGGFYEVVSKGTGLTFCPASMCSEWAGDGPKLFLLIQEPRVGFSGAQPKLHRFARNIYQVPLNLETVAEGPLLARRIEQFHIKNLLGASMEMYMQVKEYIRNFWILGGGGMFLAELTTSDLFIFSTEQFFFLLLDPLDKETFAHRFKTDVGKLFALSEFFPEEIKKTEVSPISKSNSDLQGVDQLAKARRRMTEQNRDSHCVWAKDFFPEGPVSSIITGIVNF
jgi:hypothetical protein